MRTLSLLSLIAAMTWQMGWQAAPVHAETLTVTPRQVADEKAVFATVESISVVPARGRIGGTIAQLSVREGDPVKRGQPIALIGDEKLALQLKSLDARSRRCRRRPTRRKSTSRVPKASSNAAPCPVSSSTRRAPRSMSPRTACGPRPPSARWSINR